MRDQDDNRSSLLHFPLLSHQQIKDRRRRERKRYLESSSSTLRHISVQEQLPPSHIDPLYQGIGTHYVDLWVGYPTSFRQTVIVDTGSGVTAFPCAECKDCGGNEVGRDNGENHVDAIYQQSKSKHYHEVSCQEGCLLGGDCGRNSAEICKAHRHYAEGSSWDAVEVVDTVYSGGNHKTMDSSVAEEVGFDLHFGCQTHITGLFKTQMADGIMGMKAVDESYWKQLYAAGRMTAQQFSLCFTSPDSMDRQGTPAGAMLLGGSDDRLHLHDMQYVSLEIQKKTSAFTVHLEKIYLRTGAGNSVVPIEVSKDDSIAYKNVWARDEVMNNGGTIVDSGTTHTYFSKTLGVPFKGAFKALAGRELDTLKIKTEEELRELPTILFQMTPWRRSDNNSEGGPTIETTNHLIEDIVRKLDPDHPDSALVAFPPTHYMRYSETKKAWIPQILFRERKGKHTVLGANFMAGMDVLFDVDNGRIGFAESNCNYYSLSEENPNFMPPPPSSKPEETPQVENPPTHIPEPVQDTSAGQGEKEVQHNDDLPTSFDQNQTPPQGGVPAVSMVEPTQQQQQHLAPESSIMKMCGTSRICLLDLLTGTLFIVSCVAIIVAIQRRRRRTSGYEPVALDGGDMVVELSTRHRELSNEYQDTVESVGEDDNDSDTNAQETMANTGD